MLSAAFPVAGFPGIFLSGFSHVRLHYIVYSRAARAFWFVVLSWFSWTLSCVKVRFVRLDGGFFPKVPLVNFGNVKSCVRILLLIKTGKLLCWLSGNVLLSHILLESHNFPLLLGFLTHHICRAAVMKTMHQGDEDCFGCEMFIKSLRYIMALEEGRLEIGPCGQKLPGMGSNFNSSHCSYFLFLWNIFFTCFYSHKQELHCLPIFKFCPWKIKPWGFNMGEPPVNVEVKGLIRPSGSGSTGCAVFN